MEKFNSHIDNVVGIPQEQRKDKEAFDASLSMFSETLLNKDANEENIKDLELEKTERDLEVINFTQKEASEYISSLKKDNIFEVPIENIHILKDGGTNEYTEGRLSTGAHSAVRGGILVDRLKSDIEFSLILFHEFIHAKSIVVLQKIKGDDHAESEYRSGFKVVSRDGKEEFFEDFDEAITELMTKQYYHNIVLKNEIFKDEIEQVSNGERSSLKFYKGDEIDKINSLINKLWELNKDKFSNREDIVKLFINAKVNGRMLAIGRLIEDTFGKGSFRKIGKGEGVPEE